VPPRGALRGLKLETENFELAPHNRHTAPLLKPSTQTALWSLAADPDRARHVSMELQRHPASAPFLASIPRNSAEALVRIAGGSRHLAARLLRDPDWVPLCFTPSALSHPRRFESFRLEAASFLDDAIHRADHAAALRTLRRFRERESLRIAARDLSGHADVETITRELSDLADVCLAGVLRIVRAQLASRLGEPWHQGPDGRWIPTPFCVLGLGKLGGQELNYSSDVDLLFVYGDEGHVFRSPPTARTSPPAGATASHAFFRRLAESFTTEVGLPSPDGQLYRVDLRLRPEGDAGPLARSLDAYESYYSEWGQTWERLMLLKARPIAGDRQLGAEFLETIQAFRYPRSLSEGLLDEIAATKTRLETEAIQGDAERDVKRGRGGIREIEFIVQSLQLLNAGRQPFLQGASTLPGLGKLAEYSLLSTNESAQLAESYRFWRDVEHRLQMEDNLQTHTLPTDAPGLRRIAHLMGCPSVNGFESRRNLHASRVRSIYDKFLGTRTPTDPAPHLPPTGRTHDPEWLRLLARHGFRDPADGVRRIREFIEGPGWSHVSRRTGELGRALLPHFLSICPGTPFPRPTSSRIQGVLSDPDRVLARLERFIQAYGSRSTLYEAWSATPPFFELLLWLFDRSDALGEIAIRTPDLVEEIVRGAHLRRHRSTDETLADLRHGRTDIDQTLWLRRYQQAEQLRIGLRSLLDLADPHQTHAELTSLAEACIRYALEIIQHRHRLKSAPFAVIGLGRLGGAELTFGSDLDLLFVTKDRQRDLPRILRYATEFIALLSASTELGSAYDIDTRLRPDGEKGLLVNTVAAHAEYYHRRARLWEIQALARARPIAGDATTAARFMEIPMALGRFDLPQPDLAAWQPDWESAIDAMRQRIHRERTDPGTEDLAFKTSEGGIIAAEFLAQKWTLADGHPEPNTRAALVRGITSNRLSADQGSALLQAFDQLRRIELILRRWSCQPESLLPADPAALDRVAVRCGLSTGSELLATVHQARAVIHQACSPR
jgi:[glutamine synthetase] adenylyltransferase / [glutamine synthetase]-adenylyl-L-tyrosine phosphorylase